MDPHRLLGEVLSRQGHRQEASAAYERSVKLTLASQKSLKAPILSNPEEHPRLDPDHSRVHLRLARLYGRAGMEDTAIVGCRPGVALGGVGVLPHRHLACLYGKKRHWQQSCKETLLAMERIPIDLQIRYKYLHKRVKNYIRRKVEGFSA